MDGIKLFTQYLIIEGEREEKLFLCSRDIRVGDSGIYILTKKNGNSISSKIDWTLQEILPNGRAYLVGTNCKSSCSSEYPFETRTEPDMFGFTCDTFKIIREVEEK